jgi:hypothetical protein
VRLSNLDSLGCHLATPVFWFWLVVQPFMAHRAESNLSS